MSQRRIVVCLLMPWVNLAQNTFFYIYEDEEKLFQNIKKQFLQGFCTNYYRLNKNICIFSQPSISFCATVRQYFIQL